MNSLGSTNLKQEEPRITAETELPKLCDLQNYETDVGFESMIDTYMAELAKKRDKLVRERKPRKRGSNNESEMDMESKKNYRHNRRRRQCERGQEEQENRTSLSCFPFPPDLSLFQIPINAGPQTGNVSVPSFPRRVPYYGPLGPLNLVVPSVYSNVEVPSAYTGVPMGYPGMTAPQMYTDLTNPGSHEGLNNRNLLESNVPVSYPQNFSVTYQQNLSVSYPHNLSISYQSSSSTCLGRDYGDLSFQEQPISSAPVLSSNVNTQIPYYQDARNQLYPNLLTAVNHNHPMYSNLSAAYSYHDPST